MEVLKTKSTEDSGDFSFSSEEYQQNLRDSSVIHRLLNIRTGKKSVGGEEKDERFFSSLFKKYFFITVGIAALNLAVLLYLGYRFILNDNGKSKSSFSSDSETDLESLEMLSMDISSKLNALSFYVYNKLDKLGPGGAGAFSDGAIITDQLKKIETKIDPTKGISEPATLGQLSSSKRMQFYMQLRINRYFRERKVFPQNRSEFIEALEGEIPNEDISRSNKLSFDKDNLGGWFFDKGTGKVMPNIP